jgi:hypothetical protein
VSSAEQVCGKLIALIWKARTLPLWTMPASIDEAKPTFLRRSLPGVERYLRLRIEMEHGFHSNTYLLKAATFQGCLIVYHTGHGEDVETSGAPELFERAIGGGCDILIASMPLLHDNPTPFLKLPFANLLFRDGDAVLAYVEAVQIRTLLAIA